MNRKGYIMKLFPTTIAALSLTVVGALGQGKITFANDSLHLVYWNPDPALSPPGQAGQIFNVSTLPGLTPVVDLYLGTTSASLTLITTTTFSISSPGRWNSAFVTVPGIPGGATVFAEIQVRDDSFAPPSTFSGIPFGLYYGDSVEFSFTLGGSITYPDFTGWPPGTYPLPPYGYGSIEVSLVPEPSSFVFLGLGSIAALLCCRRFRNRL
jgi:hypothetical protein